MRLEYRSHRQGDNKLEKIGIILGQEAAEILGQPKVVRRENSYTAARFSTDYPQAVNRRVMSMN